MTGTVLLPRPTESLAVYSQQLCQHPEKECLTVQHGPGATEQ